MSNPIPIHSEFNVERLFKAPIDLVFHAWTDEKAKAHWFVGPAEWTEIKRTLEPKLGGVDILHGKLQGGMETLYTARYQAIRPDDLLVYVYDMHIDGAHLSTSLATVDLRAEGNATRMLYTEQAVYFDGEDGSESRRRGTSAHFDHLVTYLNANART
ncbi:MAG: SRPBCC domain-containing protein [Pseudomonadota bacterium]